MLVHIVTITLGYAAAADSGVHPGDGGDRRRPRETVLVTDDVPPPPFSLLS